MKRLFLILILVVFSAAIARADVPGNINYQGKLIDANGDALATGQYTLSFSIYDQADDQAAGDTEVWGPQEFVGQYVVNGYFNVILGPDDDSGSNRSLVDAFDGPDRYLEITVGDDSPLAPRQKILSAPYAIASKSLRNDTIELSSNDDSSGFIKTKGGSGNYTVEIGSDSTNADTGNISIFDSNGGSNVEIGSGSTDANTGNISIFDSNEDEKINMGVNDDGSGVITTNVITTKGDNGKSNVEIGSDSTNINTGNISIFDSNENEKINMGVDNDDSGFITTKGANGNTSVEIGSTSSTSYTGGGYYGQTYTTNANMGQIRISDSAGGPGEISMFVADAPYSSNPTEGIIVCDILEANRAIYLNGQNVGTSPFRYNNYPYIGSNQIFYSSIDGPESAAYIRGKGNLVDGESVVNFPDHFKVVASPEGITVQLTPHDAGSKGLAVVDQSLDGLVIKELFNGNGSYDFDYLVMAVRKGHEDYKVMRPSLGTRNSGKSTYDMDGNDSSEEIGAPTDPSEE